MLRAGHRWSTASGSIDRIRLRQGEGWAGLSDQKAEGSDCYLRIVEDVGMFEV